MTTHPFTDFIFKRFREWEETQPKKRASISAFARWLSDNSIHVEIKQQLADYWLNGKIPKDDKYIYVLAEKFGDEVYKLLDKKPISPKLYKINMLWEFISEEGQQRMLEEAEKYETSNELQRVQKISKRPKTRKT